MSTAEKISALRLILGGAQAPSNKEFWEAPSLETGVPRGVIVELLGPYKTEWLIQFLAGHKSFRIFWAQRDEAILPTALHQRGLDLTKITFGILGKDMTQSLRRTLQSQSFQIVIAPSVFEEIRIFQAFQLFAEKSNSTLFLMGDKKPSTAWPISLQLEIHKGADQQFEIEILKQKHGNSNSKSQ